MYYCLIYINIFNFYHLSCEITLTYNINVKDEIRK